MQLAWLQQETCDACIHIAAAIETASVHVVAVASLACMTQYEVQQLL